MRLRIALADKGWPFPPRCSILSRFSSPLQSQPAASIIFCQCSISAHGAPTLRNCVPQTCFAMCIFGLSFRLSGPCYETVIFSSVYRWLENICVLFAEMYSFDICASAILHLKLLMKQHHVKSAGEVRDVSKYSSFLLHL